MSNARITRAAAIVGIGTSLIFLHRPEAQSRETSPITRLIDAVRKARKIRIVHVPDAVSTRIAISKVDLGAGRYGARAVTIVDAKTIDRISTALRKTQPMIGIGSRDGIDARWMLEVGSRAGGIVTLVVDRFGFRGEVDGRPIRFRTRALVTELHKHVPDVR